MIQELNLKTSSPQHFLEVLGQKLLQIEEVESLASSAKKRLENEFGAPHSFEMAKDGDESFRQ